MPSTAQRRPWRSFLAESKVESWALTQKRQIICKHNSRLTVPDLPRCSRSHYAPSLLVSEANFMRGWLEYFRMLSSRYNIEKDIAAFIKKEFDKRLVPKFRQGSSG